MPYDCCRANHYASLYRLMNTLILLLLSSTQTALAVNKVLFIGDSWAELADEDDFMSQCDNSIVLNYGIGGSTAAEWRDDGSLLDDALNDNLDVTSVWVSLGGNDLLDSDCTKDATSIANDIEAVLAELVGRLPQAQILIIPYGQFPCDSLENCSPSTFGPFYDALGQVASSFSTVQYVDTTDLTGGSSFYWEDCLHLNSQGYDLLWSDNQVQDVLCPTPLCVEVSDSVVCDGDLLSEYLELSSNCFSLSSTVLSKTKGTIPLTQLQVGDEILTKNGIYERVYAIPHYHATKRTQFIQIHTTAGNVIELTSDHLIYTQEKNYPIPASMINIGDVLLGHNDDNNDNVVSNIVTIRKEGLMTPFTMSGTVVVNNIVASSYITVIPDGMEHFELFGIPLLYHHLGVHLAFAPYRFICGSLYSLQLCNNESRDEEGFTPYARFGITIRNGMTNSEWIRLLMTILFMIIALPVAIVFGVLGNITCSPPLSLVMMSIITAWKEKTKSHE